MSHPHAAAAYEVISSRDDDDDDDDATTGGVFELHRDGREEGDDEAA